MDKRRILIVDDDPAILRLLSTNLKARGYEVVTAIDGAQALEIAHREKPDLIVLDIMLPKMSGFEVCKRLKKDPKTSDIPIIMVTALNELGDIERGIDSGTDDFLTKPVNKWELITRVKTMLKLKHLSDKLERTLAYLSEIEAETEKLSKGPE